MSGVTFYVSASLDDPLDQGDIVVDVPWGLIEAPVTLCRPVDRSKPKGRADYAHAAETQNPPAWSKDPEYLHGVGWQGPAMVLWHGCQIDKWKDRPKGGMKAFAAIAPILPLDAFQPESRRDRVREGASYAYFPVPAFSANGVEHSEGYVDFRHIWSVRQSLLVSRIARLGEGPKAALFAHLFTFFTRQRLDVAPSCPKCGTEVPLAVAVDGMES